MMTLDIEKIKTSKSLIGKRKRKILERDNYTCRNCPSKDNLTIAHTTKSIGEKRKRGFNHYKPAECIVLCKKCHINLDYSYKTLPKRLLYNLEIKKGE